MESAKDNHKRFVLLHEVSLHRGSIDCHEFQYIPLKAVDGSVK